METLCALHRRHLRVMAGYRWPKHISNEAIYHLTQTRPLSNDLQRARLRLLGHCLRLPSDTPAQKALDLTVNNIPKASRGRPRTCLLSTLRAELKKVGMNLRTASGLEQLRIHAADKWEETIEHVYPAWLLYHSMSNNVLQLHLLNTKPLSTKYCLTRKNSKSQLSHYI